MTNNDKIVAIVTSIAVICISLTVIFCDTLVLAVGVPTLVLLWLVFLGWINNKKLDKGEMRRAITGSIVIAFFIILIAISKNPDIYSNNKEIFSLFFGMVTTIIGYYFGYRSGKESKNSSGNE
ncbi:hypothetical protein MJ_0321 [Methanocaldococcus jannaschii DSM 2661]|uniref:Uncharacterized protein MJ0321 n=1 Tax=Methanocaldococcus jannaschii (strain ATCC 43067 / DSM 2661 / JAL-1 / JCM 10045 / NBRC 100440) TaxID=243232 RepID=Y321_METJA|nr:hypothetical protein [Methanocaldococcus jannaschii]Q57769.1 RecName: Full=Uncharacterized protein MJ0321 [Methanocaldococcus jannaschii DSM 2661]AAB98312.1 hypothetical protein MJ_0321 [Methanocaldococcus jannaschii DSM 2661]